SAHPPRPPPASTLFPYTTLFRSEGEAVRSDHASAVAERGADHRERAAGASARVLDDAHPRQESARLLAVGDHARRHPVLHAPRRDRKSTRLNSSHLGISYAVFCL